MRFLLVDRILELESGKRATGVKNITMSEDFLAYHFPEMPIMPGVLIVESLVQLADWIIRERSDFQQMGFATAFDRIKFRRLVRPGDQLHLEVEILSWEDNQVAARGKVFCGDRLVTAVDFTLGLRPLEPLLASTEARRLYRLMRLLPETEERGP